MFLDIFKNRNPVIINLELDIKIENKECCEPFGLATRLEVVEVSGINFKIKAQNIMSVQFGKLQKVTATIKGVNSTNPNATIANLAATSSDETIFKIGVIDPVAQTVEILGVGDGSATITYMATNINNDTLSLTDTVNITDIIPPPDLLATSLSVDYSAPVAQ